MRDMAVTLPAAGFCLFLLLSMALATAGGAGAGAWTDGKDYSPIF